MGNRSDDRHPVADPRLGALTLRHTVSTETQSCSFKQNSGHWATVKILRPGPPLRLLSSPLQSEGSVWPPNYHLQTGPSCGWCSEVQVCHHVYNGLNDINDAGHRVWPYIKPAPLPATQKFLSDGALWVRKYPGFWNVNCSALPREKAVYKYEALWLPLVTSLFQSIMQSVPSPMFYFCSRFCCPIL